MDQERQASMVFRLRENDLMTVGVVSSALYFIVDYIDYTFRMLLDPTPKPKP